MSEFLNMTDLDWAMRLKCVGLQRPKLAFLGRFFGDCLDGA